LALTGWNSFQYDTLGWSFDGASTTRTAGTGQSGYASLRSTAGANCYSRYAFTANTHIITGFCFKATSVLDKAFFYLNSTSTTGTPDMTLRVEGDGSVAAYRSNTTVLLGQSTSGYFVSDVENYVEVRCKASTTVGEIEVRLNGAPVPILNLAGINAGLSTVGQITLLGAPTGTRDFSAWYLLNVDASSPSNFLGHIRYGVLTPTANGSNSNWLGSDSDMTDNYLLVDDPAITPDDDSTYVQASVVGTTDLYQMTNLPTTALSIVAVCPVFRSRKTDAGSRAVAPVIRIGSTDYPQTEAFQSTSYSPYRTAALTTNPNTAAAWTEAAVNAMQVGQKVST